MVVSHPSELSGELVILQTTFPVEADVGPRGSPLPSFPGPSASCTDADRCGSRGNDLSWSKPSETRFLSLFSLIFPLFICLFTDCISYVSLLERFFNTSKKRKTFDLKMEVFNFLFGQNNQEACSAQKCQHQPPPEGYSANCFRDQRIHLNRRKQFDPTGEVSLTVAWHFRHLSSPRRKE